MGAGRSRASVADARTGKDGGNNVSVIDKLTEAQLEALFDHYEQFGRAEGRDPYGCEVDDRDLLCYAQRYADLRKALGGDDVEALRRLAGLLLSDEASLRFRMVLGGNAMGGGNTTMTKSFLAEFPLPPGFGGC